MTTLEEAWGWYDTTRRHLSLFGRLTRPDYWIGLPLDRDDKFKALDPEEVRSRIETGLPYLNDLAVVVLFSVFESIVRHHAVGLIESRRSATDHPVISRTLDEAEESLREGSFYHVLQAYKGPLDVNLVEHVNQIRKYRNWVAHGRRGKPDANVTPPDAYDRLRAFLAAVGVA
jgi:hypothetical protein